MRRTALTLTVLCFCLGLVQTARAADDEAAALIDKAIKAHFPKGVDTKNKGLRTKGKGTLHILGMELAMEQETAVQMPDKFKETVDITVKDQRISTIAVFNGKEGWIRANGQDVPVSDELLAEFKEAAYGMSIMQGIFTKDKSVTYTRVGEVKVNDKPALGITISKKGSKDINLYFDKETGLIAKAEMRKHDPVTKEEVTEERIIKEYQDVDGRKVAKKVEILHDGKPYLQLELTEVKILEKVDDGEFVQPK